MTYVIDMLRLASTTTSYTPARGLTRHKLMSSGPRISTIIFDRGCAPGRRWPQPSSSSPTPIRRHRADGHTIRSQFAGPRSNGNSPVESNEYGVQDFHATAREGVRLEGGRCGIKGEAAARQASG